jgi:kynurenine formamidase
MERAEGPAGRDIGALARIDTDTLRGALRVPTEGRVWDLGLELNARIPHNASFVRFSMAFTQTPEGTGAASAFQYCAEAISGTQHVGTHIDALIHVQAEGRIYGGGLAREARDDSGWRQFGMETVPPIVGRGVVLDIPRLLGLPRLPDGYEITIADIQAELQRRALRLRQGDIVIVRTGKIQDFHDEAAFQGGEPGVGRDAAIWLFEQGMAVLCTDTTGTEPLPFKDAALTTHRAMLVERGVHLIENLFLEDVASADVREGLFVGLPLRITGATGSWLRPVLIV